MMSDLLTTVLSTVLWAMVCALTTWSVLFLFSLCYITYKNEKVERSLLNILQFSMLISMFILPLFVISGFEYLIREYEVGLSIVSRIILTLFEYSSFFGCFLASIVSFIMINEEVADNNKLLFAVKIRKIVFFYLSSMVVLNLLLLFFLKAVDGHIVEIVKTLAWVFNVPAADPFYEIHEGIGRKLKHILMNVFTFLFGAFLCLGTWRILGEFHRSFNIKYKFKRLLGNIKQIKYRGKHG
ncbi:MAG: hypothetical protein HRT87_05430 [Legionellales bacterium]|nr:hypothetical protein [Legionellales bacterium]